MGTNHIGSLIREMRKAAGMSQMRLAEKIGVSYQQVQKYEKGASKLSVQRLTQIANVFGVPVTAFLENDKLDKVAESQAAFSNLSDDEAKLLMLYRRLRRKKLKDGFVEMLRDIVRMSESTQPGV
ncbi:MAG: helix-turn-helix transcriptional regulator [Nitrospirota bacterium]|jgi:transcriptional regulator with XRE-family HTH domain